jgi:hypothetical protein
MSYKVLLPTTTITTAVTAVTTTAVEIGPNAVSVAIQYNFDYGSGGTNFTAYIQTSLDGGTTWIDIACFQSTTADQRRLYNLISGVGVTSIATPTDGTLTANTSVNGFLGDRLRVKYTSTGTYGGSTTIQITASIKENPRD